MDRESGGIVSVTAYGVVITFLLYLIVIMVPVYYKSMSIQSIIDTQSRHSYLLAQNSAEVRRGLEVKFSTPGYDISNKKIVLYRRNKWYQIRVRYSDVVHVVYNVSLVFNFDLISHR